MTFPAVVALLLAGGLWSRVRADDSCPFHATSPAGGQHFLDPQVCPRANFYAYATGGWMHRTPLPPDRARWTAFDEVEARNLDQLRDLLDHARSDGSAPVDAPLRTLGRLHASALNEDALEAQGMTPLRDDLDRIDALASVESALRLVGEWQRRGIEALLRVRLHADGGAAGRLQLRLDQGGLGLPDRDDYLDPARAEIREAYLLHVQRQLEAAGETQATARASASAVLEFETQLAGSAGSAARRRDCAGSQRFSSAGLVALAPQVPWTEFFAGANLALPPQVVVSPPEYFARLGSQVEADPAAWKAYLRWTLVRHAAPFLSARVAQEHHRFFGQFLEGRPHAEPRWRQVIRALDTLAPDGVFAEALGRRFAERQFDPAARAAAEDLIRHLRAAFRERLEGLPWMDEPTRAAALAKLDRLRVKLGAPEGPAPQALVDVVEDDLWGNLQRLASAEYTRRMARLGSPVPREAWPLPGYTVNACFDPVRNEIVLPAGILQPPLFDPAADPARNYGAIGTVIGHEITHAFDDQGRHYDADGRLRDWWSAAAAAEFERRADRLVAQYGRYEVAPGRRIDGRLTLGENLADLGGVAVAHAALRRHLRERAGIDPAAAGFSADQRFFLAYAQVWRMTGRPEDVQRRLGMDPHAPPRFRVVGPLSNLEAFSVAFGIRPGDAMWTPPEARTEIW